MTEQQLPELERVKRLINKLMDRTEDRGCTEAEAMDASEKVGDLLRQFDLKLEDIIIRQEKCVKRELYADDDTARSVLSGISRLCSLRHYLDLDCATPTFVIFGFERDVELAVFLYEMLMEALSTEWGKFTQINGYARKKRDSFRLGFGSRVHERLVQMRRQRDAENAKHVAESGCRDLVLVRDHLVEEEFAKTGVRLMSGRQQRVYDFHSYREGAEAGARVNISTPLNGDVRSMLE
jgi:hypothetical protein